MIEISEVEDFSMLSGEGRARAEESVKVWRVRYGPKNGSADHTLAYFGMIALNAVCARAVLWAELTDAGLSAPPQALRAGLLEWRKFAAASPWTFHAFAKADENVSARFLAFLGFELTAEDAQHKFYEALK